MNTGIRIQNADRDVNELVDPETQYSRNYSHNDDATRCGISVMDTIEELAEYIAQSGIEIDPHNAVIVEVAGRWYSGDEPCDAHLGERLLLAEEIVSVTDADEAGFFELIDEAFDRLYA